MIPQAALPYATAQLADLPVLTWPVFDGLPVDAVVTTRRGGVSTGSYESLNLGLHVGDDPAAVLANREHLAAALGASLDDFVFCEQAHDRNVLVVGPEERGRGARDRSTAIQATDALVTATPGPVLVVMVADCVPLVLFDPVATVLACVHAGWRGTVRGVTTAAVEAMRALGSRPEDIRAGVGPAIAPDRYQVGTEVADAAADAGLTTALRPDGTGRWLFDLWESNRQQLTRAGVPADQVQVAELPTGASTDFFSHRDANPCGRFAAVARLCP